ncbi:uncharacterized protein [Dysidea avara]|uniref:uncharacterized protein n=1 Tax=Dysidea avara TaxID=196820 RepID=UPI00332854B7
MVTGNNTVRNDDMTNTGNHSTSDMDICYYSLDKALRHVNNNSIINITIPYDTLLSPANLVNLSNITIAGNSMSEIDCNYTGALVCKGCNNVIIKNIRWIRCGFFNISTTGSNSHNKAHHLDPIGGLYFDTCTNLTIQCCTFLTSLVQISQASETVTISNVYYTDNYTNTYPQSHYEYTYGGLYVEQSNRMDLVINIIDCSFTSMKPNSTAIQLFVVKSKDSGMNRILISSTSFTDNINNQPVPSNYGNSMVFINISSSHTNVTLSDVRFQSNTVADNGNILSIVTNEDNSTVQLLSCVFLSNTASNVAMFETKHLTIMNSVFKYNNGKSNLILLKYQTSIVTSYEGLMFSYNTGGPMMSLNSYNISVDFLESKLQHNTLSSGNGLVMLSDYHSLDVLLAGIKFISNIIQTDGSAFYSYSPIMMPTKSNSSTHIRPTHEVFILNVVVFRQSGGGHGAGIYISHPSCDSCETTDSYTLKESTFNNINDINSVIFCGISNSVVISDLQFANNLGTAVHLENSNLIIDGGLTLFKNNTAEHGAALYLDLNSRVMFNSNSKVSFIGNEARRYGGAIYCSVSVHNGCYKNLSDILLVQNTTSDIIEFNNNVGSAGGNSVYLNVPQSCDETFQSESNVTKHALREKIVTSPNKLRLDPPARLVNDTNATVSSDMYPTYLIPNIMLGQDISISSCILGYNNKSAGTAPFLISHTENTQSYSINGSRGLSIGCQPSQGISNLQITSKQSPSHNIYSYYSRLNSGDNYSDNDYTVIQLHSFYDTAYELKPIVVNLRIEISPCHSGFYYSDEMCVCYTTDDIVSCSGSTATITRGYWFGVISEQPTVGVCPVNYCDFDKCGEPCTLLPSPDKQCGEHRTGTACGNCKDSYALSFDSVDCVSTINCTTGLTTMVVTMTCLYWIFTIVVVFAMMYFKVGIGYLYGITFYYSVIDILLGQALRTSDALYRMVTIVSSLARLTPQFLGQICFVIGLSGIDQQFIHYIHPLALLVILLLISISVRFSPRLSLFVSRGVIHVICFLLLLSYTSIASTSLLLMRPLKFTEVHKLYTYLSPDLEYFHGRHLAYGLVAIACGIVIVIGLPLILLLEPFLNHKINFTRIKPLLDQFQGYYKDKYRYFASYYMICRLVMLIIVNANITNVFVVSYLQLVAIVIMTLIHVIVRPYVSKTLNAVDALLLLTMILVTILQPFEASNGLTANTITGLAFTLVVFPLLIFLLLVTPFMNRQHIKEFIVFCKSTVKSIKKDEPRNKDIEMPNVNQQYEVTVDDALRKATATTIATVQEDQPNPVQGRQPSPVKFRESLLELGID